MRISTGTPALMPLPRTPGITPEIRDAINGKYMVALIEEVHGLAVEAEAQVAHALEREGRYAPWLCKAIARTQFKGLL